MAARNPAFQGAIFFAIFFVAVFGLEGALFAGAETLFNARLVPRGLGWVVMPLSAGLAGWAFGQQIGIEGILWSTHLKTKTIFPLTHLRAWIAGSAIWTVVILGVFLIFDPFDRYRFSYWREEDWFKFAAIFACPPFVGLLGAGLFQWAFNINVTRGAPAIDQSNQKYIPSEAMLRNLFWTLAALSVVNGKSSERKAHLIQEFHLQLRGTNLDHEVVAKMADSFVKNGPERAKDILSKYRSEMRTIDREMLIKFNCLLISQDRPITEKEREFIYSVADALEVSRERLLEL